MQQQWPLPDDWQPQQGRGLRRNKGPEALVPLPGLRFLLAAESSLQQDSSRQLGLLLAELQGQQMRFKPLGSSLLVSAPLAAKPRWGLTALLPAQLEPAAIARTVAWLRRAQQLVERLSLLPPVSWMSSQDVLWLHHALGSERCWLGTRQLGGINRWTTTGRWASHPADGQ